MLINGSPGLMVHLMQIMVISGLTNGFYCIMSNLHSLFHLSAVLMTQLHY